MRLALCRAPESHTNSSPTSESYGPFIESSPLPVLHGAFGRPPSVPVGNERPGVNLRMPAFFPDRETGVQNVPYRRPLLRVRNARVGGRKGVTTTMTNALSNSKLWTSKAFRKHQNWPLNCNAFLHSIHPHRKTAAKGRIKSLMATRRCTDILTLLFAVVALQAQGALAGPNDAGTFGAPFLRIPVGARLTATPDIVAGLRPDASLLFSNPAVLSGIPSSEVFFTTSNWLDDMRFSAASAVFPIARAGISLSVGTTFLYSGDLKGFDEVLNVVAEENYYDVGIQTAVSKRFESLRLSLGAGVTYIRQHLYPNDGDGAAFTAGGSYGWGANEVHLILKNFGGKVSFPGVDYQVAAETVVGLGRIVETRYGRLNAGAQLVFSRSVGNRLQCGLDYRFNRLFSLRTSLPDALGVSDETAPFSAGFGVEYGDIALEYAYTPRDYFLATHTVSMVFALGQWRSGRVAATEGPQRPGSSGKYRSETAKEVKSVSMNGGSPEPPRDKKSPKVIVTPAQK